MNPRRGSDSASATRGKEGNPLICVVSMRRETGEGNKQRRSKFPILTLFLFLMIVVNGGLVLDCPGKISRSKNLGKVALLIVNYFNLPQA